MMKVIKDGDVFEITQQDEHKRVVVVQPRPGVAHLMLYRPACVLQDEHCGKRIVQLRQVEPYLAPLMRDLPGPTFELELEDGTMLDAKEFEIHRAEF